MLLLRFFWLLCDPPLRIFLPPVAVLLPPHSYSLLPDPPLPLRAAFFAPRQSGYLVTEEGPNPTLFVNLHYSNEKLLPGIHDNTQVEIFYTPTVRNAKMGHISNPPYPNPAIPPGARGASARGGGEEEEKEEEKAAPEEEACCCSTPANIRPPFFCSAPAASSRLLLSSMAAGDDDIIRRRAGVVLEHLVLLLCVSPAPGAPAAACWALIPPAASSNGCCRPAGRPALANCFLLPLLQHVLLRLLGARGRRRRSSRAGWRRRHTPLAAAPHY